MKYVTVPRRWPLAYRMALMLRIVLAMLAVALIVVGIVNFTSFMGESARLGGDAGSGYAEGGHYYVGDHGRYREVSREDWEWSRFQGQSIMLTHPLLILGSGYVMFAFIFPLFLGRSRLETPRRVEQVRASGPVLASTRCSARIGLLSLRGPLLSVAVHAGGVVLSPILMGRRAVLASEIADVQPKRSFLSRGLEIRHRAADLASPVILYVGEDSPVARAIEALPGEPAR